MDALLLARWQFGLTASYHFIFVSFTLGMSIILAVMETIYVVSDSERFKVLTKFFGKLFLINFAMGVVTGIVMEFHFGMNWSEYSRYVGDIFGAPLAMEALTAFFLESTFLGVWIFGWNLIGPKLHAACMWVVALASNISAFWILAANSFMQSPVGYALNNNRVEMTNFNALLTNKYLWHQFPHVLSASFFTAGIVILAVSCYYLLYGKYSNLFKTSALIGVAAVLAGGLLVMGTGHLQTQHIAKVQPMKLAAVEALWESADPAPFALAAVIDEVNRRNNFEIKIPGMLSLLAYNSIQGEVKGLNELQRLYSDKFGPDNYIPSVAPLFWSFRLMIGAGAFLILLALAVGWLLIRERKNNFVFKTVVWSLPLPFIANTCGWFVTEVGRQPWTVVGLHKVSQGVSSNVAASSIVISLIGYVAVYTLLAAAAVFLVFKVIQDGPATGKTYVNTARQRGISVWS